MTTQQDDNNTPKKAAIIVGQFSVEALRDKTSIVWRLHQGERIAAEGSLDFVLSMMFERIKELAAADLKEAVEKGESVIKHTITAR